MHPVEDTGVSPWPVDMVEFGADAHRKQAGIKQLYNQVPQMAWVSWSPRQAEFSSSCSHSSSSSRSWGQDAIVRVSARQRAWALRTPVEQPSRMRKKCCYNTEELGVNMWQSVSSSTHLSHITHINPFANKMWEVYFSKEVCSFVITVDYVSACICIHIVLSWLYNSETDKPLFFSRALVFTFMPDGPFCWIDLDG